MKKVRVALTCKVCHSTFEVRPSEVKAYATCSRECSLKYRSIAMTGRKITWGDKISLSGRGRKLDSSYITPEYREKKRQAAIVSGFGKANKGKALTQEHRNKIRDAHLGRISGGWKLSEEACMNRHLKAKKGAESSFWRGGVTEQNKAIRSSFEYKQWRRAVFVRDDYTCRDCGSRGVELHADHIKPFAHHPEYRFDINNGRTLCVECHKKTPTYLWKASPTGMARRKIEA